MDDTTSDLGGVSCNRLLLAPDFGQPGLDLALEALDQLAVGVDQGALDV